MKDERRSPAVHCVNSSSPETGGICSRQLNYSSDNLVNAQVPTGLLVAYRAINIDLRERCGDGWKARSRACRDAQWDSRCALAGANFASDRSFGSRYDRCCAVGKTTVRL